MDNEVVIIQAHDVAGIPVARRSTTCIMQRNWLERRSDIGKDVLHLRECPIKMGLAPCGEAIQNVD